MSSSSINPNEVAFTTAPPDQSPQAPKSPAIDNQGQRNTMLPSSSSSATTDLPSQAFLFARTATALENNFARLQTQFYSLQTTVQAANAWTPIHDWCFCLREFNGASVFFGPIDDVPGNAIEATRLRRHIGHVQKLSIEEIPNSDAERATVAGAEQLVTEYQMYLAMLRQALDNVAVAQEQHEHPESRVQELQRTTLSLEDGYAKLKARYHHLSFLPDAGYEGKGSDSSSLSVGSINDVSRPEPTLYEQAKLDEAFGEGPMKRSEVETQIRHLQALHARAAGALRELRMPQVEETLAEAEALARDVRGTMRWLEGRISRLEERRMVEERRRRRRALAEEAGIVAESGRSGRGALVAPSTRRDDGDSDGGW